MAPSAIKVDQVHAEPKPLDAIFVDHDIIEPIAVIGFSLKFPEDATSSESFWKMLMEGRSAMTKVPASRFNSDSFYVPGTKRRDELPLEGGHFLEEDLGAFDAPFFNISPVEASAMDPMQRMMLETAYRAFENAGLPLEKVTGSNTSVFSGCFTTDYLLQLMRDPQYLPTYAATGVAGSLLANRLSWFFDLKGSSVNLDSACSSSGMALDWACSQLRDRSCNMSVVGGCNLTFAPEYFQLLTNMNMLSHSSRSFSFDSRANGYARGEGFGVVILKRLDDAIKDGDTIRAVIRSTGSNQDGRTPGITQPSSDSQERLIRETYRKAGLSMALTRFCEAHGTGTAVGDPIESMAIGSAFKEFRTASDPLFIGALKSNIGHLEGAAGIAGLIKAVLCLEKGIIPPNVDFREVNPKIDPEYYYLSFPTIPIPWPTEGLRRASINSFGFGGSNSHIVVDDAYNYLKNHGLKGNHCTVSKPPIPNTSQYHPQRNLDTQDKQTVSKQPKLLVLSAGSEVSLETLTACYSDYFKNGFAEGKHSQAAFMDDLAYTLGSRRSHLSWRSFSIASSVVELQQIERYSSAPRQKSEKLPRLGFVFTGQGAQWYGMGQELMIYPVFRKSIYESDMYLRSIGCTWSIFDYFRQNSSIDRNIDTPLLSQTLCTVLQIGLVNLLEYFGIKPSAVCGHSSGEIAAAYAAGALTKESALKVAYFRGLLATSLPEKSPDTGAMLAVALSAEKIEPYFTKVQKEGQWGPVVACYNSPESITVSGIETQIDELASLLNEANVFNRKLRVNVAYHSPQMTEIANEYLEKLASLTRDEWPRPVGMVSSVTGEKCKTSDLSSGSYWVENMISSVRFSQAVENMCNKSPKSVTKKLDRSHRVAVAVDYLLEIGPHGALKGPVREILNSHRRSTDIMYDSVLNRNDSAVKTVLEAIGRLHCAGYGVNLTAVNELNSGSSKTTRMVLTDLPEYQFNHSQRYWHESRITSDLKYRDHKYMELLGRKSLDWNPLAPRWRHFLRTEDMPWVEDHKINGVILYPGAGMLAMAIEAARTVNAHQDILGYKLHNITFSAALDLSSGELETQIALYPQKQVSGSTDPSFEFVISSYAGHWSENCKGIITVQIKDKFGLEESGSSVESLQLKNARSVLSKPFYDFLLDCGYGYGPSFQRMQDIQYSPSSSEALAKVSLYQDSVQSYVVHPTTLDAIMHLQFAATSNGCKKRIGTLIPTKIDLLWIAAEGLAHLAKEPVNVLTKVTSESHRFCTVSIRGQHSDTKRDILKVVGLETTAVATTTDSGPIRSPEEQVITYIDTKIDVSMASSQQILEYLMKECPAPPEPAAHHSLLQFHVFEFLREAKKQLRNVSLEDLPQHIKGYLAWMDYQLDQSDKFDNNYPGASYGERPAEELLYKEVGKELTNVLTQKTMPTQLLFESGLLDNYYLEKAQTEIYITRLLKYVDLLAHKNPSMKIIEVGGGTGTFTGYILDTLERHSDGQRGIVRCNSYEFTDIGPLFLDRARKKFEQYSDKMNYGILNIEKDPSEQGFEAGSYDLVVAISVIHATRTLEESLINVRKLLKPSGVFLLQEPTTPTNPTTGFVFGILPGWWLGTEENRQLSPLVEEKTWNTLMLKTGFTGTELVLRDYESDLCHEMSFIISRASAGQDPNGSVAYTPKLTYKLVIEEGSVLQQHLAKELQDYAKSQRYECDVLNIRQAAGAAEASGLKDCACIFLPELEHPFLTTMEEKTYDLLKSFLLASSHILWLTQGGGDSLKDPGYVVIDGFARSLRLEVNNLKLVSLALQLHGDLKASQLETIFKVMENTIQSPVEDYEREFVERNGMLHTNRIVEANTLKTDFLDRLARHRTVEAVGDVTPVMLDVEVPGQLDTLHFKKDKHTIFLPAANEVEIEVRAIDLEFSDYSVVAGRSKESKIGSGCCGVVLKSTPECAIQAGDRVWMYGSGMCKTVARAPAALVTKLPDDVSFEQVCALPPGTLAVTYALHEAMRIRKGDTMLVHCSKLFLEAAIQVALAAEVDLYVVADDETKKEILSRTNRISENHIISGSRFSKKLKNLLGGRGVDVILNSVDEDIGECFECLSAFGTFVDITDHRDANYTIQTQHKSSNVTSITIKSALIAEERPHMLSPAMERLVTLVAAGTLRPFAGINKYPLSEVKEAFEDLGARKEGGKVMLTVDRRDEIMCVEPRKRTYKFPADATYVISGLGGLGRSVARWMGEKGAKNLLLLSRSGGRTKEAMECISSLRGMGVIVEAPKCNVSNRDDVEKTIARYKTTMPPVKGCIHLSKSGNDALFENMPYSMWRENMGAKADGAWNLHETLPKGLDFFVMFASIGGVIGSVTLVAYGASNHYLDGLAQYRISQGEKAISLDYGVAEDDGRLAEDQALFHRFMLEGKYIPMPEYEFLALLDYACDPTTELSHIRESQPISGIETPAKIMAKGFELPNAMRQPLWSHMYHVKAAEKMENSGSATDRRENIATQLDDASTIEAAADIITVALVKRLSRTISVAEDKLDINRPMHTYGVDSLTAVDLRNWFANTMGIDVAVFEILGDVSFANIGLLVARKYKEGSQEK